MRRLDAGDLKDLNLFKHYPIIVGLIYLDCIDMFTKHDFEIGSYSYSWDNKRWNKLLKNNWIKVWRKRNRTTQKYNIYKVSFKCKQLINKIYKIILGYEDIPTSERRNIIMRKDTYTNKVLRTSIYNVNNDINR